MRVLHARPDHERDRPHQRRLCRRRSRTHPRIDERQSLPLLGLCRHRRGGARRPEARRRRRRQGGRMKTFNYVRPATIADAIAASAAPGAAYLAAGTNLLDLMKVGAARPDRLIDITRLPGLDRIEWLSDGSLRIGALVRNADLAYDPLLQRAYPAVAEALLSGASAQL